MKATASVFTQPLRILCIRTVVLTDSDNQIFTVAVPFTCKFSKPKRYSRLCTRQWASSGPHFPFPCLTSDLAPHWNDGLPVPLARPHGIAAAGIMLGCANNYFISVSIHKALRLSVWVWCLTKAESVAVAALPSLRHQFKKLRVMASRIVNRVVMVLMSMLAAFSCLFDRNIFFPISSTLTLLLSSCH